MRTVPPPDLTTDQIEDRWGRIFFLFAAALAIAYALFAGLHTVDDFDTGWQIATGRYIVQHKTMLDRMTDEVERLKSALREADRWLREYHNIQAARDTIRQTLGEY